MSNDRSGVRLLGATTTPRLMQTNIKLARSPRGVIGVVRADFGV